MQIGQFPGHKLIADAKYKSLTEHASWLALQKTNLKEVISKLRNDAVSKMLIQLELLTFEAKLDQLSLSAHF